jgi:flagellar biosynthesis protein FlhB
VGALGATLAAATAWPSSALALRSWTGTLLALDEHRLSTRELAAAASLVARMSAPALVGAWAGAYLAGVALSGFHFDLSLLRPRMERLAPLRQLARRLSPLAFLGTARPVVLILLLGMIAWASIRSASHEMLTAIARDDGFVRVALRVGRLGCTLALVTAVVGVADALARIADGVMIEIDAATAEVRVVA